jgi:hypothetical protein
VRDEGGYVNLNSVERLREHAGVRLAPAGWDGARRGGTPRRDAKLEPHLRARRAPDASGPAPPRLTRTQNALTPGRRKRTLTSRRAVSA